MKALFTVGIILGLVSQIVASVRLVSGGGNTLKGGNESPSFSPSGVLVVSSVYYRTIWQVNPNTGALSVFVPSPYGEGDDSAWAPDGTIVWNSLLSGLVRSRTPDGTIRTVAEIPWPNGIAFNGSRCFVSTFPVGSSLYEVDPHGVNPPVLVMTLPSPMNGFNFGKDGLIYGPLPMTGQVIRVNVNTHTTEVVADGFADPEGVRVDSQGKIYVLDTATSQIIRLDISHGLPATKTVIATVPGFTYLDNFAIGPDGNFYVSDSASNAILKITPYGTISTLTKAQFGLPGGISLDWSAPGRPLYVADIFDLRTVTTRGTPLNQIIDSADQLQLGFGAYNIYVNSNHMLVGQPFNSNVQLRDKETLAVLNTLGPVNFPYDSVEIFDDAVIVADFGSGLTLFHGPNLANSTVLDTGAYNTPVGLARNPSSNLLYFTDYATGSVIQYNLCTHGRRVVATGLNAPEGIAVSSSGLNLIVAEVGAKRIIAINTFSGSITSLAANLNIGLGVTENLPPPNIMTGVAVTPTGTTVYFTSDLDNALYAIDLLLPLL